MLKFLKTMVAEDVIITEEALVADLVAEEVLLQEEKVVLLQEEKDHQADLEATEVLLLEKAVSDQEAHQLQEQVVFQIELQEKVHLTELQDVPKALVTHQDQEDQEETNNSVC
jgi:DNA-dependent RNA polymerase auxiliary subunit epsilon